MKYVIFAVFMVCAFIYFLRREIKARREYFRRKNEEPNRWRW